MDQRNIACKFSFSSHPSPPNLSEGSAGRSVARHRSSICTPSEIN